VEDVVDATRSVERVHEDRPESGVRDNPASHRDTEAEEEDRQRDHRDRRDRSQELDHQVGGIEEGSRIADEDTDGHAEHNGDREALGVAFDRSSDLACERATPYLVYERAQRRGGGGHAVAEVKKSDERLGQTDDQKHEEPTEEVRSLQERARARGDRGVPNAPLGRTPCRFWTPTVCGMSLHYRSPASSI
jgi:hypothetical protein